MKSFSKYISEVAQPRERGAEEEQAFKDQHTYEVIPHPVALDTQFTGDIQKPQAMRPADNKGDHTYDKAYAANVTGFEEFDESVDLEEDAAHSDKHVNMAIGIASDKRYKGGNMTGAVKAMNKMKPGISDHPKVAAVLKRQNEDTKAEALSPKQKKIDHDKDGDIDGKDLAALRAKKKKPLAASYNEELDETTNSALLKPVTTTAVDGKKRTVMKTAKPKITDDNGQDKIITNESILKELAENVKFKVGLMKLKDGKSVVLKKQDADLLTQMFKDLSPNNRRKLGAVAMKDQSGLDEILGFAREAL